ncbi:Porin [Beijerinckiaceae bacterium RH CH11]|nr:porin family protein [Beijerinckiaceae bacterium]VVB44655.1 Porin [Beijerinckiaceae bacterium RH CH11]VVB44733.1 Porin [Beijerinckiaceae bacterium RH AL8]
MIKKILLSTVTLGALAGTAFAADLPSRRAPPVYIPPPIPVFTWTGLYVGGQVGYEFGKSNAFASAGNRVGLSAANVNANGVIGGAHVGYNFSTQSLGFGNFGGLGAGGLVLGVEGDVDGSNYKSNYLLGAVSDATRQDIQGSVRGRLGVAFDRFMVYGTGGAAFGDLKNNYTFGALNSSLSHTRVGWTAGGGVEYAISNNWSLRAEYRYTDFGTFNDQIGAVNVRHHETDNRVQGGFSYKFDTFVPAPVVARY